MNEFRHRKIEADTDPEVDRELLRNQMVDTTKNLLGRIGPGRVARYIGDEKLRVVWSSGEGREYSHDEHQMAGVENPGSVFMERFGHHVADQLGIDGSDIAERYNRLTISHIPDPAKRASTSGRYSLKLEFYPGQPKPGDRPYAVRVGCQPGVEIDGIGVLQEKTDVMGPQPASIIWENQESAGVEVMEACMEDLQNLLASSYPTLEAA